MKKWLAWMLLSMMIFMMSPAQAESTERASAVLDVADFEKYPSYMLDAETGAWSVRSNAADALEERFWTYGINNGTELCVFTLEIEGDARTGVWTPVLRFYVMHAKEINATAVSILIGEERYDFAARSGEAANGRYTAECISVPLTREAMAVVEAMIGAEEVSFRLMGDTIKTVELDRDSTNSRRVVEAESLNGLSSALQLLNAAGLPGYSLWDLSADAWEKKYGFEPAFAQCTVERMIGETSVSDDFGMVERNDQTNAAKAAQTLLIENGFMLGTATTTFGKSSVAATRRAQHFYGLIETGCMDAVLVRAMQNGTEEAEEPETVLQSLGGIAEIALNRYWFADGFSATGDPSNVRTVFNEDNIYLISDGWIRNVSAEELKLYSAMEARLVYGDAYSYEAVVVCERNDGREIDVTMLPMAQSRLIVYAEVPAWLAEEEDALWDLVLTAGDESLIFSLQ